jgi:hypothetical protein
MDRAQRISIGVVALLALVAGGIGVALDLDPTWPPLLLRAAIVIGAIWFAGPVFHRVTRRVGIGLAVVAAVIVVRPRLILWALVVGALTAIVVGRSSE